MGCTCWAFHFDIEICDFTSQLGTKAEAWISGGSVSLPQHELACARAHTHVHLHGLKCAYTHVYTCTHTHTLAPPSQSDGLSPQHFSPQPLSRGFLLFLSQRSSLLSSHFPNFHDNPF